MTTPAAAQGAQARTPWTRGAGDPSYICVPVIVKPIACGSIERAALILRAVNEYDRDKATIAALTKALETARVTIKAFHGPIAWDIYEQLSPEMREIDGAIKLARGEK